MKKLLLSLALSLAVAASASAAQTGTVDKGERYDYKYPVFSQLGCNVENRINNDIKGILDESRAELKHDYMTVGSNYDIIFENDKYICLSLITWSYSKDAAHPLSYYHGIVYSKKTGKRVPYTEFAPKLEAAQFKQDIMNKKYTVYCADMETVSAAPFLKDSENFEVSDNYIINADGSLYIVYQPYDLDCYAAGPTFVKIK